jgi:epoxyqueuosine reductase
MVCPHNARTVSTPTELGEPLISNPIDLVGLFPMTEEAFSKFYGRTPLSRAKRHGLLRNAAIVLGNQRYTQAIPILKKALAEETDPGVLDACRWAIEQLTSSSS